MKRREEEKLINLAFGELPEEEACHLENSVTGSSKAASKLVEYRRLKDDLALLGDVPEPQISKERIREAILRGGLKSRRNHLGWVLVAVPSLAALVAVFIVLNQPEPMTKSAAAALAAPKQVAFSDVAHLIPPAQTEIFPSPVDPSSIEKVAERDYSFGDVRPIADLSSRHARRHFRSYATREPSIGSIPKDAVVLVPSATTSAQTNLTRGPSDPPDAVTTPAPDANDAQPIASNDSKIIVVHDTQDQSTGTEQATEVDRTANVLVGG